MQVEELRKGAWFEEEDEQLTAIVEIMGDKRWDSLAKASGLRRSGKSCRLRWLNYLRPNLKHGRLSGEEEKIILQLHKQWGNKWSKIARRLPGRTDNEVKNYWRSHLRKKAQVQGQGYCASFTKNAKQEVYNPPCDSISITSDGSLKASDDPLHALELSNYAIADSPYESRLTDWASGWLEEQSEVRHHGDCQSLGLCFCYPVWNSEDCSHTSIWSSSGPLWNVD
ncbi:hypothetical protein RHSIM_RhsimUnG0145400 [Rhododendron simsii]|uniref:Uncharacterized protein n=1 Tax=Rhododendron simsii TaxID=118357 RepID=A0A834FVP8_RHOSS|nr:hypothetical protein RHSIM_RhsimUnG0145400 [Rhododendron simsii]